MQMLLLLCSALALALAETQLDSRSISLAVSTTSGHIHGKISPRLPNVRQFLGIPFALPPTGGLRWTAPKRLFQPDQHVIATELPPSCPQFLNSVSPGVYTRDILEFNLQGLNTTGAISEDCLTTSVWTPRTTGDEKLPVLIFFYGGGFQTGGQDVPYQIPAQWVNRSPDHIVVSFNYRVGIFGFPGGVAGLPDKNLGLLDQRAAVEWCKENIAAFGGDPERMVIWGQSAGSASVDFYNYAYPKDPIVSGLIMDSGVAFIPSRGDLTGSNFSFVADKIGCGSSGDTDRQLACMKRLPFTTIQNFVTGYSINGSSPGLDFGPIADEKTVFANYTRRALAGQQAKIPAIIGTNAQDGVPFAPYNPNGPNQTLAQTALLNTFFCPATESIRLRQQTNLTTYRYLYAGNFSNISPEPWLGAYHSSELPLLMGTHPDFRGKSTKLEWETSCAMQDAWVAFARDSRGDLECEAWEAYKRLGAGSVREFGGGVAARDISIETTEAMCDGVIQRL